MIMSSTSSTWITAGDTAGGTVEWRTAEREEGMRRREEKKYDSIISRLASVSQKKAMHKFTSIWTMNLSSCGCMSVGHCLQVLHQ